MREDCRPRITVVAPVYNQMATIEEILCRIQAVDLDVEIVVVDDGATESQRPAPLVIPSEARNRALGDGIPELLAGLAASQRLTPAPITLPKSRTTLRADNIRVFFQDGNRGKRAAKAAWALGRKLPSRSRKPAGEFTRPQSLITAEPMRRGRKSPGKMVFAPFGVSSATL